MTSLPRVGFLELGYGGVIYWQVKMALEKLGYIDGKNVLFEPRYAADEPQRLAALADELVRANVDVIVTPSHVTAFVARKATSRIPIVVRASHGGVETGLYASLARPGANVTGTESLAPELDAKRVEFLEQIVPRLSRLAVLLNPADPGSPVHMKYTAAAARAVGVAVEPLELRRAEDVGATLAAAAQKLPGALLVFTDEVTDSVFVRVVAFALGQRLPTMGEFRYQAEIGCLMSYGPTLDEFDANTARKIDRILKGAKPGDLPVEQPTRYELVFNQRVARAIGVTIPRALLVRADSVIE